MANAQLTGVVRHIRRLVKASASAQVLDSQLLQRFITQHDEAAFTELVGRHGGMVLGVCRSVLRHTHDAEDVFQATFLLLALRAASIRNRTSLASWLHGVAYRLAQQARRKAARRRTHEQRIPDENTGDAMDDMTWRDLRQAVHQEMSRLPEKLRAPILLCCLEGKTRDEAARQLGCTPGTLKGRLERGRSLLRRRLARRGLAPSAFLATLLSERTAAAVPGALLGATVRAAQVSLVGRGAAAGISAPVRALVQEGLKSMLVSKLKIGTALVLAVGLLALAAGVLAHRALAGKPGAKEEQQAAAGSKAPRPSADQRKDKTAAPVAAETMTVTGRVLGADGKAAANARVAVVGRPRTAWHDGWPQVLGQGRADAEGKFRLSVPRPSRQRFDEVYVLAGGPGHGLARADFSADAKQPEVAVTLARPQVFRGRLIDLQGLPAQKVQVHVLSVRGPQQKMGTQGIDFWEPPRGLATWPQPATSDAQGRFSLQGLPAHSTVTLQVQGNDQFAHQRLEITTADKGKPREVSLSLAPVYLLEGTVTFADTGKPVPNARLRVITAKGNYYNFDWRGWIKRRADARGQFHISPPVGDFFTVVAYPPPGTPYVTVWKDIERPKPEIGKRKINLALPRGVLVRGKVTERQSGKAVAGASVHFEHNPDNNRYFRRDVNPILGGWGLSAVSGADGAFELPVLPGPGHLLITAATPDYVRTEITTKQLAGKGTIPNWRNYPHAAVALSLKPQAGPHKLTVELRRGVTLRGTVVGPDGKAVKEALLVSRSYISHGITLNGSRPLAIKDGRFELPGCDPARPVQLFILDAKNQLGATAEVPGKSINRPLTVKLRRCGQARVRLVGEDGKPVVNLRASLEVVLTPGVPFVDAVKNPGPTADTADMFVLERTRRGTLRSDAQGRISFSNLIPGATFVMIGRRPTGGLFNLNKDFKAEAGRTLDLGNIVVKPTN
jgi:RNA polymerase sigma factor (sigma-70 family)